VSECFYETPDSKTAVIYYVIYIKSTKSVTYLPCYLDWQRKEELNKNKNINNPKLYYFHIFSDYQYSNNTV
jgi:hypothetical protein